MKEVFVDNQLIEHLLDIFITSPLKLLITHHS